MACLITHEALRMNSSRALCSYSLHRPSSISQHQLYASKTFDSLVFSQFHLLCVMEHSPCSTACRTDTTSTVCYTDARSRPISLRGGSFAAGAASGTPAQHPYTPVVCTWFSVYRWSTRGSSAALCVVVCAVGCFPTVR